MKKTAIILFMLVIFIGNMTIFASHMEISGGGAFATIDRSYEDAEEDFLVYYHSGCSQSMKIMPAVEEYAEKNDLTLYIVDYRKSKIPGAGEYTGNSTIIFPIAIAYNHGINSVHAIDGIRSQQDFENFADNFFSQKNPEIKITIDSDYMICNGKKISLDVPAQIINNRTMIPLRAIAEAYDFVVQWDEKSNRITATKYATKITMYTNNDYLLIGNMEKNMYHKPQIIDGRTLVSARGLAEAMGAEVLWDDATKTITIK